MCTLPARSFFAYSLWMARLRFYPWTLSILFFLNSSASAAPPNHAVTFGKWTTVQASPESGSAPGEEKPFPLKVRALLIDGTVKEYTFGAPHDFTDRLFVVRRAFRINDNLPQESTSAPHWKWERGGWLLVDRITGHISSIDLPDFEASFSIASWYRDYAAYCGFTEDEKKVYAVVAQLGRRKPILKKILEGPNPEPTGSLADSLCAIAWQRNPSRVTFEAAGVTKQTFAIRGHTADVLIEPEDDEEASK